MRMSFILGKTAAISFLKWTLAYSTTPLEPKPHTDSRETRKSEKKTNRLRLSAMTAMDNKASFLSEHKHQPFYYRLKKVKQNQ